VSNWQLQLEIHGEHYNVLYDMQGMAVSTQRSSLDADNHDPKVGMYFPNNYQFKMQVHSRMFIKARHQSRPQPMGHLYFTKITIQSFQTSLQVLEIRKGNLKLKPSTATRLCTWNQDPQPTESRSSTTISSLEQSEHTWRGISHRHSE
jgi:hypothetical protein